jgi:hypothetical protein
LSAPHFPAGPAGRSGRGRNPSPAGRLRGYILVFLTAVLLGETGCALWPPRGSALPEMTREELREKLGNPEILILDVRKKADWEASARKIPGAVHEDYEKVAEWAGKYPREKTRVLYCA